MKQIHLVGAIPGATLLICALLTGCSTPSTKYSENGQTAEEVPVAQLQVIDAKIEYEGNRDYLPRSLKDSSGSSGISAVYAYDVSYGTGKEHPLTVFNPLLITGMSKTEDRITVTGTLEFFNAGNLIRKYNESVTLTKNKTIYSEGETFTEMRRHGLLYVRNSIDKQIYNDRLFWADAMEHNQAITPLE